MLKQRIITAVWAIPVLVAAAWFDTPISWFTLLAAIVGVLAAVEFLRIASVAKNLPLFICGLVVTLGFVIYPNFSVKWNVSPEMLLLMAAVIVPLIILVFQPVREGVFQGWTWTAGGILYIGFLLSFLVALRLDAGRSWLFFTLFATFASDTFAYLIGKAIGKHKMAPHISPGKTWEGAVAGVIASIIVAIIFAVSSPWRLPFAYWQAGILGALVSVFGQIGDLAESIFKRSFAIKDSGGLMPGHGGLLDRLDSVLFAGVVVYLYYFLVVL